MDYNNIIYEKSGAIAKITLNRPEARNALTLPLADEFWHAIKEVEGEGNIRSLLITGAGKTFCSGGDVNYLITEMPSKSPIEVRNFLYQLGRPILALRELQIPVIACINGPAVGAGFDLLLHCDIRIASQTAKMGSTWILNGVIPVLGGMFLLPKIVGLTKATEMIFTGELIDAQEAHKIGLINKVVADDQLHEEGLRMANKLASGPPLALSIAKNGINRGLDGLLSHELLHAVYLQASCFKTDDFKEGLTAFLEKRKPNFKGK